MQQQSSHSTTAMSNVPTFPDDDDVPSSKPSEPIDCQGGYGNAPLCLLQSPSIQPPLIQPKTPTGRDKNQVIYVTLFKTVRYAHRYKKIT